MMSKSNLQSINSGVKPELPDLMKLTEFKEWEKEQQSYRAYILSLATQDRDVIFYNSSEHHGAFVMGTMFSKAKDTVKIFAGNFSGHISNKPDYKKGLEIFLRKGGNVEILLQEEKFETLDKRPDIFQLLGIFKMLNHEQVKIKTHPFSVSNASKSEVHFMVADGKMYRIEDDVDNFTAAANFNDPKTAKTLTNLFDEIFAETESKEIVL